MVWSIDTDDLHAKCNPRPLELTKIIFDTFNDDGNSESDKDMDAPTVITVISNKPETVIGTRFFQDPSIAQTHVSTEEIENTSEISPTQNSSSKKDESIEVIAATNEIPITQTPHSTIASTQKHESIDEITTSEISTTQNFQSAKASTHNDELIKESAVTSEMLTTRSLHTIISFKRKDELKDEITTSEISKTQTSQLAIASSQNDEFMKEIAANSEISATQTPLPTASSLKKDTANSEILSSLGLVIQPSTINTVIITVGILYFNVKKIFNF